MSLYKGTYYTAGILSLIGILLVGFIIQGSIDLIGPLLYIAYFTLALIISFVLFFTFKNIFVNFVSNLSWKTMHKNTIMRCFGH